MAGENGKGFGGFFGRFRERFEKLSESVTSGTKDDMDLILAAIQRIDLEGEEVPSSEGAQPKEMGEEEIYERIMRRLQWQLSRSGITSDELVRTFPGEVQSVLLQVL